MVEYGLGKDNSLDDKPEVFCEECRNDRDLK